PITAEDPNASIAEAVSLLEDDINFLQHATQTAIRTASVYVERGEVSSAQGAYVLAIQYKREQNFQGAEALFKRAIALDPTWSRPYAGLGNLLGRHSFQRTEEAMEVLQKSIELDPEWGRPHNIMAVILRAAGRFEEARAEAELALKYMPNEISPLNNYANLLVDLERYDEAETYFRRAIESYPEHPKPYYNLACLFSLRGRTQEALENLKEAFQRSDLLRREAVDDVDLAPLRDNLAFQALLDRRRPPA
ncbi:MAG: tetratricopeptide repeat protein, partial [Candidatus Hydrogenedentes bacterium]|nr:tetratricopeptide repeat protein [Candidatus Hydrogenedentota bacterium]